MKTRTVPLKMDLVVPTTVSGDVAVTLAERALARGLEAMIARAAVPDESRVYRLSLGSPG